MTGAREGAAGTRPRVDETERSSASQRVHEPSRHERGTDHHGPGSTDHRVQHLQRTHGNRAVQRLVEESTRPTIQPKLTVRPSNDRYEREAERVAERVVGQRDPPAETRSGRGEADGGQPASNGIASDREGGPVLRTAPSGASGGPDAATVPSTSSSASSGARERFGRPLDRSVREEMSAEMGYDFANVRVFTDEPATQMARTMNARAFTYGSDIYFDGDEYDPSSSSGKRLLAHELTHVVQQSGSGGGDPGEAVVQRTSVGDVLDNFFSPMSSEKLWVMGEGDNYTQIVRQWGPVINAVGRVKNHLESNCETWSTDHATDPSWEPGKTDPPETDPNAYDEWVSSPPGTDPTTCRNAFIVYMTTSYQTSDLYTCSIGSFGIYATVDSIDCANETAELNVWMYNAMDQESFGKYADHPVFSMSGMERQYMWWNWSESHSWGGGSSGGSSSGGSGGSSEDSGWF